MKRTKRIALVPNYGFVTKILPSVQSKLAELRFTKKDQCIQAIDVRVILHPAYASIAESLTNHLGHYVASNDLIGLKIQQNYVNGKIVVSVNLKTDAGLMGYNIELIPAHTDKTLFDLCVENEQQPTLSDFRVRQMVSNYI